jgi:hypothetical protein
MAKPTTDHEHYCAITQAFIDDIDSDGPGPIDSEVPVEFGDQDATAAPRPNSIDVGGPNEQCGTHRYSDDTPIDLDGLTHEPGDEKTSRQADDASNPTPAPETDETGLPASDLVDRATSTSATVDSGGAKATTRGPRYNKNIAIGFAAATVAATLLVSGALLAMRSPPHTNDPTHPAQPTTRLSVVAAPSSTTPAPDNQDSTIPYTATSVGCLPGSSAAQSVAGPDPTQAWVCVTGGNVGQYLVLNLGRSMVITAVSITPGWVGADASGADQWHQHRILTRVQWSFNDTPPTVVPQQTASVHGEAAKPMPNRGVLASRIIMLVQETGRAPADTAPTTTPTPGGGGGILGEVLGPPAAPADPAPTTSTPALPPDSTRTDPADNTFAVSSIKIFGHPPQ